MNRVACVIIAALVGLASSANYEGYKVYKVRATNEKQNDMLATLQKSQYLDFWSAPNKIGATVSVMVSPDFQESFEATMDSFGISHHVLIKNVQRTIERERLPKPELPQGNVTFDHYMRHEQINLYLDTLAADYPQLVSLKTLGQSFEGRDMTAVVISTRTNQSEPRPTIYIDAGVHAREWIAPSVALYIIYQLVEASGNEQMVENVDWVILPSLNPDGYEYSWAEDRLWRKTRSPGQECDGTDANRNFDFHWDEANGASTYECAEDFGGPKPYSEVEARNLRDLLAPEDGPGLDNVELYLSFHSYGPYVLYPWGFTEEFPDNVKELDDLGHAVSDAVKAVTTLGTEYEVGSTMELLYPVSGCSVDWAMGYANISLTYTVELPGGGDWGFDLPEELIRPVVEETWEGVKVFHKHVEDKAKTQHQ